MRKTIALLLCTGLALFVFAGCTVIDRTSPSGSEYTAEDVSPRIVEANTRFAFEIFGKLNAEDAGESLFISPLSITTALTMTYNGAGTTTREAMEQTLGWTDIDRDVVNEGFLTLLDYLGSVDDAVTLHIANSIWIREGQAIQEDFLDRNRTYFDAEVSTLDFTDPSAADTINDWIAAATREKIDQMIDPPIDASVIMYLINAIYFQGLWSDPFDPDDTFDSDFTALDGTEQDIRMMRRFDTIEYAKGEDYKAVRLPYGSGAASMTAILPAEDVTVNAFIDGLDYSKWETIRGSLSETEKVTLQIPRFTLEYGIKELNEALKSLGMAQAFDARADFSGIRSGIYISEVLHKAVIEVNEEGSEAAAATVVVMEESAAMDPAVFIADRPFIFLITDDTTGTILFIGKMAAGPPLPQHG